MLYICLNLTSFVCTQFVLFDSSIGRYQVQLLRARVDVGVITMKGHSAFPKSLRREPLHQIVGWGFLPLCRDAVGVFYSASRLGSLFYLWINTFIFFFYQILFIQLVFNSFFVYICVNNTENLPVSFPTCFYHPVDRGCRICWPHLCNQQVSCEWH